MSENTNSRTPKLVGKSFFFTEPDKVEQSTNLSDSHAFGPMGTTDEEKAASFRLGAKMKLKAGVPNAKAFAICSGNVLLQPQTGNSAKVNLILRPMVQPFNAMPVKYFIYRGLDKADFLSDETKLATTGPEFLTGVRNDFASLNNVPVASEMLSKWIGYELGATPDTDLIDDMFFRISDPSTEDDPVNAKKDELPFVREGVHLGHFSGDFQLDIVLGSPDFKPLVSTTGFLHNLTFARAAEGIIAVAGKPSNYPEKAYREAILDFIDPAAFWGMHAFQGGVINVFTNDESLSKSSNEIYLSILRVFTTCHVNYLYLKGRIGRSYGYYDSPDICITGNNSLVETTVFQYYQWPFFCYTSDGTEVEPIGILKIEFPLQLGIKIVHEVDCNISEGNSELVIPIRNDVTQFDSIKIKYPVISIEGALVSVSRLYNVTLYETGLFASNSSNNHHLPLLDKDLVIRPIGEIRNQNNYFILNSNPVILLNQYERDIRFKFGFHGFLHIDLPEIQEGVCAFYITNHSIETGDKQNSKSKSEFMNVKNSSFQKLNTKHLKFIQESTFSFGTELESGTYTTFYEKKESKSYASHIKIMMTSVEYEEFIEIFQIQSHKIGISIALLACEFEYATMPLEYSKLKIFRPVIIYESLEGILSFELIENSMRFFSADGMTFNSLTSSSIINNLIIHE
jgi:hypothetical protein